MYKKLSPDLATVAVAAGGVFCRLFAVIDQRVHGITIGVGCDFTAIAQVGIHRTGVNTDYLPIGILGFSALAGAPPIASYLSWRFDVAEVPFWGRLIADLFVLGTGLVVAVAGYLAAKAG